jgi:hypothetical protein
MNNIFFYLLKVNAFIAVVYLFYWVVLKHTTFHQLNRYFFLSGICLSFLLPWVHFSGQSLFHVTQINLLPDGFGDTALFGGTPLPVDATGNTISLQDWKILVLCLYIFIALLLCWKTIKGILFILKLRKSAIPAQFAGIRFYTGPGIAQPFSFFKWIFFPSPLKKRNLEIAILKHEKVHADQWHTLDLLLLEIITIVLWFNPFIFLLRRSLKQVHEYQADSESIESPGEKADYLRLIVSNARLYTLTGIASQFYWLTIKKRINMITKNKSTKLNMLSYVLIIPILAISTMAFSSLNLMETKSLEKADNVPCISPIKESSYYKISSGWGMREHPVTHEMKMHNGIDFSAKLGTEVIATADGRVIKTEFNGEGKGYGRVVYIQHSDVYTTLYTQLSEFKVKPGDMVKQGDVIGLVGKSGVSTGPHLHYEVWKNGKAVDPAGYFK